MRSWELDLPTSVFAGGKTMFALNMNTYRNANFRRLDAAKKSFAEIVKPKLEKILPDVPPSRIRISYTLYAKPGTIDVANVCSIVDKFFSDCLTETGFIPDDNRKHLPLVAYGWGDVDRDNPRVEVLVEEIE